MEDTALRETLNGTTYNSLSIKKKIKKVKKDYIPTYNADLISIEPTEDYLWLLSCGEIWDNGYNGGSTRGLTITTEGKQYKYYKMNLGSTKYSKSNNIIKKPNVNNSDFWWLRSPYYNDKGFFCLGGSDGSGNYGYSSSSRGVAPGFSI